MKRVRENFNNFYSGDDDNSGPEDYRGIVENSRPLAFEFSASGLGLQSSVSRIQPALSGLPSVSGLHLSKNHLTVTGARSHMSVPSSEMGLQSQPSVLAVQASAEISDQPSILRQEAQSSGNAYDINELVRQIEYLRSQISLPSFNVNNNRNTNDNDNDSLITGAVNIRHESFADIGKIPDIVRDIPQFDGNPAKLMQWIADVDSITEIYAQFKGTHHYQLILRTIRRNHWYGR